MTKADLLARLTAPAPSAPTESPAPPPAIVPDPTGVGLPMLSPGPASAAVPPPSAEPTPAADPNRVEPAGAASIPSPAAPVAPAVPNPAPGPASGPVPSPMPGVAPAPGLKMGVVVRRVVVSVKPGQDPPPQVVAARQAAASAGVATSAAEVSPTPSAAAAPRTLEGRRTRAGATRASIFEKLTAEEPEEDPWHVAWRIVRRVPAWTFSILLHLLLLWLLMQVVTYVPKVTEKVFTVVIGEPGGEKKHQEQGTKGKDNEKPPEVIQEPTPVETPVAPTPTEDPTPTRDPVIAQGPTETSSAPASGVPAAVQGRGGAGKGDLLKKYGGSEFSEQAVTRGLKWLVRHQAPTGEWDAVHWDRRCPADDRCGGVAEEEYTTGLTGLSLLCFLGAGQTHKDGEFADNVRRALNYLRRVQTPEGLFDAPLRRNTYNHAICTLAVSEAYAMSRNEELGRMAQQGITFLCKAQQPGGGWDYTDFQTDRNDISISGWCIMALKSAKLAGLPVPWETWDKAKKALLKASTSDGRVRYADKAPHVGRLGDGLTAVGMACRYFMSVEDKLALDRASRHLLTNTPLWRKLRTPSTDTTFYYWYYGTLAMFQRGGRDWERWNGDMRDMLIRNQRKDGHVDGSWDPDDAWIGPYAGRLYSTTLNILNLEVYYRYLPLYVDQPQEIRPVSGDGTTIQSGSKDPRAVGELTNDKVRTAEELLLDLQARDTLTRWKAARGLADIGEVRAIPVLLGIIPGMDATSRAMFLEVLARFDHPEVPGFLGGYLDDANERVRDAALKGLRVKSGLTAASDIRAWLKRQAAGGK